MSDPSVHIYPDHEAASQALARHISALANRAADKRGRFVMALAGGGTPQRLYELLAGEYRDGFPWEQTHLFWGDERFVPWNNPDSNYYRVHETMIKQVPIPQSQIYRIITETGSPHKAAQLYQAELMSFCRMDPKDDRTFDVALLGIGKDGHTASLFPENTPHEDLSEDETKQQWVKAIVGPDWRPPVQRITLTYAALNRSDHAIFLVTGHEKRKALRNILDQKDPYKTYPATYIDAHQSVEWYVDIAAYVEQDD